jgi:hypothetical protein
MKIQENGQNGGSNNTSSSGTHGQSTGNGGK